MRNYTVHFLDDKEFEALPYRDTETSLGLADTHTREAYVRRTGINPIDMFTAMHELEHLEEGKEGVHAHHEKYGDGVYYKGFGEVVNSVFPIVPALQGNFGPMLDTAGSMFGIPGLGGMFGGGKSQQQMYAYSPQQYSWNPNISTPQTSQPNISTPSSYGLGAEEKTDPTKQQSLFDLLKTKGQYSGR